MILVTRSSFVTLIRSTRNMEPVVPVRPKSPIARARKAPSRAADRMDPPAPLHSGSVRRRASTRAPPPLLQCRSNPRTLPPNHARDEPAPIDRARVPAAETRQVRPQGLRGPQAFLPRGLPGAGRVDPG